MIENRLHQLQAVAFKQLYQYFKNHPPPPPHAHLQPRKRSNTIFLSPNTFQHDPILMDAANHFSTALFDLYETPRIQVSSIFHLVFYPPTHDAFVQEPLWLNMSTYPQRKPDYEANLIKELMGLIQLYENKTHHFFISTLLTGVLMHHLSWVHSVAPPETTSVSHLVHLRGCI